MNETDWFYVALIALIAGATICYVAYRVTGADRDAWYRREDREDEEGPL